MASTVRLNQAGHQAAAVRNAKTATALLDAGEEWAAVVYFYAVFHLVKASYIDDPIWDDEPRLIAKHAELTSEARFATNHNSHPSADGSRNWGSTDLVRYLLPGYIHKAYTALLIASYEVRYDGALSPNATLARCRQHWETINRAYWNGDLKIT